jgi:hypothetical protein
MLLEECHCIAILLDPAENSSLEQWAVYDFQNIIVSSRQAHLHITGNYFRY